MKYYGYVDRYSTGKACFAFTSTTPPDWQKWTDGKAFCAGAYDTEDEAFQAAKALRKLITAGETAIENAEFARDFKRRWNREFYGDES